jgi:DNA repair exonuclease SbcCD ATPase subunit
MLIQKINSPIKKVSKIFNIADIHIRLFKRKEEYLQVFHNLYAEIAKEFNSESIIVLTGDIVHTKSEMSPEMVEMVSDFFRTLANIGPTIVVAGNHDCNLNNSQRLDAISPIIKNIDHDGIFYLKKTGLYEMGDNIVFSNMSIFDKVENYIRSAYIDSERKKIALFHGVIDAAVTDTGFRLRDKKVTLDLFTGFDLVLIGDIHRHQVMQMKNESEKKPFVVYPSSLIQQNYGEIPEKHGMLIWNVDTGDYEFRKIKNRYGYITLEIDNGEVISGAENMPEFPRIRLAINNTSAAQLKNCLIQVREKYKPEEVTINRISGIKTDNADIAKLDLSKIRDVSFQDELISEYLARNFPVDQKTIDAALEINRTLNRKLPVQEITRNVLWKPKLFQFSNMFSYGENNVIDFSKMGGIVGLFSANASGKSSMLEALAFCLFDKCAKAFKASHILNNQKDKFSCELNFEINGVDYFIRKVGTKKDDKVNVKIDFWKSTPDGEIVDMKGEQRRDTSAVIRSYVGTYEDFMLTALSSQSNNANFVDLGQTERKDLLAQFMDVNVFDSLFEMGSDEIKGYSALLKEFQKRNFEQEMLDVETQLTTDKTQQSIVTLVRDSLIEDKKRHNDAIIELAKKLVEIDTSIMDIDSLNNVKHQREELITKLKKEVADLAEALAGKMSEFNVLKEQTEKISVKELEEKYEEFEKLENLAASVTAKRDELKIHVKHKLDKVNKLGELEYDPNCKYCMNNIFVKDAIQTKQEISDDMIEAKKLSDEKARLDSEIESRKSIHDEWDDYQSKKTQMQQVKVEALQINSKKSNLESRIVSFQNDLEKIEEKIVLYYHSKESIENNKKIEQQIKELKSKMTDVSAELERTEKELIKISSSILYLEKQKDSINRDIESFKEMEEKYVSYQYYLEAIKRDSIPYELISKAIPAIESEINNILNQIVDFTIMLDLDGKNINAKIVYDENRYWPLELTSGMERFISGLAIRVALLSVSNLPRPTFLAIDEGFSSLDPDNASNLPVLLDYLKSQFEFVLTISHMDYMRDFVDISLDLKKVDDYSKIIYN